MKNDETARILPSQPADLDGIFQFYDLAIEHQKRVSPQQWRGFKRPLVEREITENRQWKMLIDGQVACIWAITFNDPEIWDARDLVPSIYLHRIVTHPDFRGRFLVEKIADWAKTYAFGLGKKCVRMDTWGDNSRLLEHYQKCGFEFIGYKKIGADSGLPAHYEGVVLSLFEIKLI